MKLDRWSGVGVARPLRGKVFGIAVSAAVLSLAHAGDASACGGCLVQQTESTQVTSHRMVLSMSPEATTLWDQITYSGSPESFAWVLPVAGVAEVGLSSDAMFETLDQDTAVQVVSPQLNCAPVSCNSARGDVFQAPPASPSDPGVEVVAQQTVGPYQTVQLRSTDPNALRSWLAENGYNLPDDIAPIVDAYIAEGFDFLALKLIPGEGVSSMRPVRITTPGASPSLPLRMVAAGTGAVTPITLWVIAEGRYEPTNFSSFQIGASDLVWDWDKQTSNYKDLRAGGFAAADGKAWLVEAASPLSVYAIRDSLTFLAENDPAASGYADEAGQGAVEAARDDLEALFGAIPEQSAWVTRLYGELSRGALAADLAIGASADQAEVPRFLQATRAVGTAPACPPPPPGCDDGSGSLKPGSCAVDTRPASSLSFAAAAVLAGLALARRRRR